MAQLTIDQAFQNALQHHQAGRLPQAERIYRRILGQQPEHVGALYRLGVIAIQVGRNDAAVELIRRAVALRPDFAEAHGDLGNALQAGGKFDEAIAAFRQVIALKPDLPVAYYNLGNALQAKRRIDEAIAAFRAAIALKPNYPQAYSNLGNALQARGQFDEAIAAYRRAIGLNPNLAEAQNNLGDALKDTGRLDESIAAYRQAIALNPNLSEVHTNLGCVFAEQGQVEEAIACHRRAIAVGPGNHTAHSNLLVTLNYDPGSDGRAIAEELRRWNHRHAEPLRKFIPPPSTSSGQRHANDRSPNRRLRIGYFSPRFCELPEGRFMLPLIGAHDRGQVEIICYSDRHQPDAMTERIRQSADGWRDIAGIPDQDVADLVRKDQIDVAVDLMLHGRDNRLRVFARKPAPVQVTYLAYCSSTGLKTIDYRLSDPYLDPPGGDESIYSEKTIRLPETYWCYRPFNALLEVSPLPAFENKYVTFGCLNNFHKVNEPTLAVWAGILRAAANSQLLLYAREGSHRQVLKDRLQRDGIDPSRVRFVAKLPIEQYFDLYRQIDIALDTSPYGGGTTTCDALWMGVPVVSLVGKTAVGRAGLSILSNLGVPELVGRSQEQYSQIAVALANDLPRLGNLRSTLRQKMEQSPLMDAPRFARNIEAAYRQMWRTWCAKGSVS